MHSDPYFSPRRLAAIQTERRYIYSSQSACTYFRHQIKSGSDDQNIIFKTCSTHCYLSPYGCTYRKQIHCV